MPALEPQSSTSSAPKSAGDDAELHARAAAAESLTLEHWMQAVVSGTTGSMTVRAMEQTMSWKVTRPLRAVRIVIGRMQQAGVRKTLILVRTRLREIRQAKKRA